MRGMTHRWERRPGPEGPARTPPGYEPLVARTLAARGIFEPSVAASFCEPRLTDLHDPSLLAGLDPAAEALLSSLLAGERIAIYGDYDVDGVCASAILWHACRQVRPEADLISYIPHRVDEGYGMSEDAVASLADAGVRLIVSVDCGITAIEPARLARARAVRLVITDHHSFARDPEGRVLLPDAHALVHPLLPGPSGPAYPFGDLSGAGVAFKLAWRLLTLANGGPRVSDDTRRLLLDLLSLAALGAIADVVPIVGENRVIAWHGLRRMRSTRLVGLDALICACGLDRDSITDEQVGFSLAPRVNAAGRMGHARESLDLLLLPMHERAKADGIARSLSSQNDARRTTEREIWTLAAELAERAGMTAPDTPAVVLAHESWHPGVVGIACSRLVERFHRPVALLAQRDAECRGSARSIDGFDLHAALQACAQHLSSFGGHAMAAGLALPAERLGAFTEAFTLEARARLAGRELLPRLVYDTEAAGEELTVPAVRQLEALGPFGRGNERPLALLRGLRLSAPARPLGSNGAHLELHATAGSRSLRLLAWGWGERRERLPSGARFDAIIEPKVSTWSGRASVEPVVKDVLLC